MLGLLAFELSLQNNILYPRRLGGKLRCLPQNLTHIDRVAALLCYPSDSTEGTRREHNFMFIDEGVFVNSPEDIATRDVVSGLL